MKHLKKFKANKKEFSLINENPWEFSSLDFKENEIHGDFSSKIPPEEF